MNGIMNGIESTWCENAIFGETATRTFFDLARLHRMTQWWHWMALAACCLLITMYVTWLYRRDSLELPRGTRWVLLLLRIVAFAGLLVFFLNLEKRTEKLLTRSSRLVLLIDTSQSMSLTDTVDGVPEDKNRIAHVTDWLTNKGASLDEFRKKHDVAVYRFDEKNTPISIATFPKIGIDVVSESASEEAQAKQRAAIAESKTLFTWSFVFLGVAILALISQLLFGKILRGAEGESWSLLVAAFCLIVGVVFYAVCNLRNPTIHPQLAFGYQKIDDSISVNDPENETDDANDDQESAADIVAEPTVDWEKVLDAQGVETRLGDVIRAVVQQEQGGPISGVVVLTDGANNAGLDESAAATYAKESQIKIFPIGIGSDQRSQNVRVVDMEVPPRVFPGDNFTVKAYIQAEGIVNERINVRLVSKADSDPSSVSPPSNPGDASKDGPAKPVEFDEGDPKRVVFTGSEIKTVEFQAVPDAVGRRVYTIKVDGVERELNLDDNQMSAQVEIVERRNRVLLFAGGPNREYRFLRNQLFRDKETEVDVLLQTAPVNAAQESNNLLLEFPSTPNEMFAYDCVIAFDPDWTKLAPDQIQLLDRWVAEKAGGLLAVAGPVNGPKWTRNRRGDSKLTPIRNLYPVTFFSRLSSSIQLGRTVSETAWKLKFSEAGRKADFLRLEDEETEEESVSNVWDEFDGVYGYFSVKDAKPGATVYSYFSDPQTSVDQRLPVYMAGQFYGAGRVFYLGSAEMWRMNELDLKYFERFYTKLIRFVSQGRLLRDSSRGVLIVDKERCMRGENVSVRAALSDAQFQPLKANQVKATLVTPGGKTQDLNLKSVENAAREGLFAGQFTTLQEGTYRIDLLIPESQDEILSRDVRVSVPRREIEKPQRDDNVLSVLAATSGGLYYVGLDSIQGGDDSKPNLFEQLNSMDQETYLPGTSDEQFQQRLMSWLLGLICGALCLEWLIRRLSKLA